MHFVLHIIFPSYFQGDSREYKTILQYSGQLISDLQAQNLEPLVGQLLESGVIKERDDLELKSEAKASLRATRLVQLIRNSVQSDRRKYYAFLDVLRQNSQVYGDILRGLKDIYSKITGKYLQS